MKHFLSRISIMLAIVAVSFLTCSCENKELVTEDQDLDRKIRDLEQEIQALKQENSQHPHNLSKTLEEDTQRLSNIIAEQNKLKEELGHLNLSYLEHDKEFENFQRAHPLVAKKK